MNERQEKILSAVIHEYTKSAIPVGSKVLFEKYNLGVSSATIRNDMMSLEKDGYLFQPHTSAGRVPTDEGYRFFVEEIMGDKKLSLKEQKKLQIELLKLRAQKNRMGRTTAKLLSALSNSLVITGTKEELHDFGISELLKNPEFKEVDEFCQVVEALEYIDENVEGILKRVRGGETRILIGKQNPIKELPECSMVVSSYEDREGERGLIAILGPKRMNYAKNKSLLEYVKKVLGAGMFVVLIVDSVSFL